MRQPHPFVMYRIGEDLCGRCLQPRSAHVSGAVSEGVSADADHDVDEQFGRDEVDEDADEVLE